MVTHIACVYSEKNLSSNNSVGLICIVKDKERKISWIYCTGINIIVLPVNQTPLKLLKFERNIPCFHPMIAELSPKLIRFSRLCSYFGGTKRVPGANMAGTEAPNRRYDVFSPRGSRFLMFTSRTRLTLNPFNPNTLPTNARRTLPFLYCMSNSPSEPISHGDGAGGRSEEGDSNRRRAESPLAPAGSWRGRTGKSVIYCFIIKIREGTGAVDGEVNLMTQA